MSVKDNLRSRAALYGITGKEFKNRLDELSELLGFEDILNRTVGKLSGGQRRRIDIARALLHNPKILILDEPTTGLDPQTRQLLWSVVTMLRKTHGLTVFLTTHYMEESADSDYMVQDKVSGARVDLTVTPVKKSTLAVSYYISTLISTLAICVAASVICFIYLSNIGWYLSFKETVLFLLDVILLVMFGTALSSIINFFLNSQGQISAVGTIVSTGQDMDLSVAHICPSQAFLPDCKKLFLFCRVHTARDFYAITL